MDLAKLVKKFEILEKKFYSRPKKEQKAVLEEIGVDNFEYIRNMFDRSPQSTITRVFEAINKASKGKSYYFPY